MEPDAGWRGRVLWMTAAALLLVPTASCGRSAGQGASGTSPVGSPSALATDPAMGRTPVYGSTTCAVTARSSGARGAREIVHEHFSCVDEMSDPRVSGSDEIDVETIFSTGTDLAAPWTAELVLSNDGGVWRGTCTGALEFTTDPLGLPMNYGICTLFGEGAYAGLGYTYLVAGGNEELLYSGWIEPTP
jgi:hypothetical protein